MNSANLSVPENQGFFMFAENACTFAEKIQKAVEWSNLGKDEKDMWIARVQK